MNLNFYSVGKTYLATHAFFREHSNDSFYIPRSLSNLKSNRLANISAFFLAKVFNTSMKLFLLYSLVLRCQTLLPPLNGFFVRDCSNAYGSSCIMGCNDGYNMIGSENLTCLRKPGHITGYWNGSIPVCKGTCNSQIVLTYQVNLVIIRRPIIFVY